MIKERFVFSSICCRITRRTSFCLLLLGSMGYMIYVHKETEGSEKNKIIFIEWPLLWVLKYT